MVATVASATFVAPLAPAHAGAIGALSATVTEVLNAIRAAIGTQFTVGANADTFFATETVAAMIQTEISTVAAFRAMIVRVTVAIGIRAAAAAHVTQPIIVTIRTAINTVLPVFIAGMDM